MSQNLISNIIIRMKKVLLGKIDDFHNSICEAIHSLLKTQENNTVRFYNEPCYFYVGDGIICYRFERMYIENGTVMVDFTAGEGFEPYEGERDTEELTSFTTEEIIEIIRTIND